MTSVDSALFGSADWVRSSVTFESLLPSGWSAAARTSHMSGTSHLVRRPVTKRATTLTPAIMPCARGAQTELAQSNGDGRAAALSNGAASGTGGGPRDAERAPDPPTRATGTPRFRPARCARPGHRPGTGTRRGPPPSQGRASGLARGGGGLRRALMRVVRAHVPADLLPAHALAHHVGARLVGAGHGLDRAGQRDRRPRPRGVDPSRGRDARGPDRAPVGRVLPAQGRRPLRGR